MIKQRIWEILEISRENDHKSKIFDIFISVLIGLNIFAIVIETENFLFIKYELFFYYFEIFSIFVFTTEYFLRLWSCIYDERYKH